MRNPMAAMGSPMGSGEYPGTGRTPPACGKTQSSVAKAAAPALPRKVRR